MAYCAQNAEECQNLPICEVNHQRTEGGAWGLKPTPWAVKKGLKSSEIWQKRKILAPPAQIYVSSILKPTPSQIFRYATATTPTTTTTFPTKLLKAPLLTHQVRPPPKNLPHNRTNNCSHLHDKCHLTSTYTHYHDDHHVSAKYFHHQKNLQLLHKCESFGEHFLKRKQHNSRVRQ